MQEAARQLKEHKTATIGANRKGREIRRGFEWRAASRDLILFPLKSVGTLKFPLSIKTSLAPRWHRFPRGKQMALSQFIWPCRDPISALLTSFIGKPQGAWGRPGCWDEVRKAGNGVFQT